MRHTARPTKMAEMKTNGLSIDSLTGMLDSTSTSFSSVAMTSAPFSTSWGDVKPSLEARETLMLELRAEGALMGRAVDELSAAGAWNGECNIEL